MKKTKRFLAMLLTLILCVGEISSTGLRVYAAGDEVTDGNEDLKADDTATVGIGTKFYIGERLPKTDDYFKLCYIYSDHGWFYGWNIWEMAFHINDVILPVPVYRTVNRMPDTDEESRIYYFDYISDRRMFENLYINIYSWAHELYTDFSYECLMNNMMTIGLEVDGGSGKEEDPYTLKPIIAGSDQPYVAVILNDNLDGKLTDRFFVENGKKATIPEPFDTEGKAFTGWYTDKECTVKFDFDTVLTDNIQLYAGWRNATTFKVTFYNNYDPSDSYYEESKPVFETKYVEAGEKVNCPADKPIINDRFKAFAGWYTSSDCKDGELYDFSTPVTKNLDLYAKWVDATFYDIYVGTIRVSNANMDTIPCDCGTASYDPETNTLTFKNAVLNSGHNYNSGRYAAIYTKDSSLTIKGDLTIDPTKIPSGGNALRAIYAESSEYKGNTLELDADITIKGYTRGINALYTDVSIAGGLLELEANKSVVTIQDAKLDLSDGVKVTSPDGAVFREETHGEVKAIELFESATSDTVVTKATIGSTKPSYTVTFDMNGHGDAIDAVKVTEGKTVAEPEAPKADGWVFGGWYTSKDCKDGEQYDFTKAVTGDITLYAKWTGVERTVTFDANGKTATDMPEAQKVENGMTATRPATDPAAEGYKFTGWYTEAACTDKYNFDTPVTADITIYAGWKEISLSENTISALDPRPVIDETTKELYLVKGQKFTLDSSWSVDNSDKDKFKAYKKLISISKKGKVSAKKPGDAVIVKKDKEGNVVQTISVNICRPELNKKTLKLEAGEKGKVEFSGYGDLEVYYYCASPDVATVAPDGTVTAVAKGTAKVTAYVNGSAYTRSVKVTESSAVKERPLHLNIGSSKSVKLKGVKKTVWDYAEGTTDDEKAVVEIKNAKVTAKKAGTVTLTAKGDLETYTMTVKVDDPTIQPAHADGKYDIKAGKGKNKYELIIKSGEELDISYADLDQPVVFKSNKPETAFIDEDGHIEARSSGKAKFTAKVNGKSITISVTVK